LSPRATALRCAVDLVCLTYDAGALAVVLVTRGLCAGWRLRSAPVARGDALPRIAARLCAATTGHAPLWCEQAGALTDGAHPDDADVSVTFVAAMSRDAAVARGATLRSVARLPAKIPARQRAGIDAAVAHLRARADSSPAAFRLLPPAFTLGDLQQVHQMLQGRRMHTAGFRRALSASGLVHRTAAQRTNSRGRPAQLYRYAPMKKRGTPRGIRFG